MLPPTFTQYLIATLTAAAIALFARLARLLSTAGAIAAFLVGAVIFGAGGVPAAAALLAFFFSSSLLSRLGRAQKQQLDAIYEKGSTRDAGQVLANGLIPCVMALGVAYGETPRLAFMLFLSAIAAVNADTWATEIGALFKARPRLVTTFKPVDAGTSGAVSLGGMVAAFCGALFIALIGLAAWPANSPRFLWPMDAAELLAITWGGFVAAFADSILGATIQAQYRCDMCGKVTERSVHCNRPSRRIRGATWCTNDTVNLLTSLLGAFFAWLLLRLVAKQMGA